MEDICDLISIKYGKNEDRKTVLEISTCNSNRMITRTLYGMDAKSLYNLIKNADVELLGRSHKSIFTIFKDWFPNSKDSTWWPNGENSIRIKMVPPIIIDEGEYIFTYNNEKEWSLETLKNYKNIKN